MPALRQDAQVRLIAAGYRAAGGRPFEEFSFLVLKKLQPARPTGSPDQDTGELTSATNTTPSDLLDVDVK
jgi:hypothetical protein